MVFHKKVIQLKYFLRNLLVKKIQKKKKKRISFSVFYFALHGKEHKIENKACSYLISVEIGRRLNHFISHIIN